MSGHAPGQQWAQHGDDPTKVTVPDACPFAVQAQTPERAARIVQCVNAHEGLVTALRSALQVLPDSVGDFDREQAESALAMATGGTT